MFKCAAVSEIAIVPISGRDALLPAFRHVPPPQRAYSQAHLLVGTECTKELRDVPKLHRKNKSAACGPTKKHSLFHLCGVPPWARVLRNSRRRRSGTRDFSL